MKKKPEQLTAITAWYMKRIVADPVDAMADIARVIGGGFYDFPECVNHADKSVLNEIREAKYKHCRECLKTGFQQFVTMKTKSSMTRNMRHSDSMPYALEL